MEKVRGIQAAMAKQMADSMRTIPHFSVSDELHMDALMALRNTLHGEFAKQGVKLSFMPLFIKALSLTLNAFPLFNAKFDESANELTYYGDHNIGFAVDTPFGLVVPNIKAVQTKSLLELATEFNTIVEHAKAGKLPSDAFAKGSITISNVGVLGGINATPIINKPELAIVALGKLQKLPRFDESGNVRAANLLMVSWSADHRIIDGATMVRFNNLWCDYLTQPETMLMHLK